MTQTTPKVPYIAEWLYMKQSEVLDKFASLKGAYNDCFDDERFVFVPGTRKDRVLLVAHADTVFGDNKPELGFVDGVLFSKSRKGSFKIKGRNSTYSDRIGIGIGADDRAGCAILWLLRNLGHSLLITSGEEIGCITSRMLSRDEYWSNELNDTHNFMVQFDRRNFKDIVFYDVGTKDFATYVKAETKYKPEPGGNTDIAVLCTKICGVNMSVGYYNEHTAEEKLVLDQWQNTLTTAYTWLSKPDLPKHQLDKSNLFRPYETNYHNSHQSTWNGSTWTNRNDNSTSNVNSSFTKRLKYKICVDGIVRVPEEITKPIEIPSATTVTEVLKNQKSVMCKFCAKETELTKWIKNKFKCAHCNQEN